MTTDAPSPGHGTPRERAAWVLFDFANSPLPTILLTAFGNVYFAQVLVGEAGLALGPLTLAPKTAWGVAMGLSMALVTVTSPFLGRIADRRRAKRAFLTAYVLVGVAASFALGLVPPGAGLAAFLLYVLANFAFEGAYVFYNAFLPELAPPERVGRLSGWAWGIGYAGGLGALILAKPLIPDEYAAADAAAASRIFFLVAAWYLVFSVPSLLFLRDRPERARDVAGAPDPAPPSVGELRAILRGLAAHPSIVAFLLAFFLYNDAVTTVIQFTGIYTNEVLGFTPADNVDLFLVMNGVALPGAIVFGFVQDRLGGRRTVQLTLLVWIAVVAGAYLSRTKADFWPVAFLAATVIGATQSASRALMARLAPADRVAEHMGLLALSGKASAIVGPVLYGAVASGFATEADPGRGNRIAVAALGLFFVVALGLLFRVREPEPPRP